MSNQKSEHDLESERQPAVPSNTGFPESHKKDRQRERQQPIQLNLLPDDQLDLFDSGG